MSTRPRVFFRFALALLALLLPTCLRAHAQRSADFAMTYTQERTKFVGLDHDSFFFLRGASIDLGYDLYKGIGVAGRGTGLAVTNLDGSLDIHQVQGMGGLRYTYNLGHITDTAWNRHGGVFAEGMVGYTLASQGLFPVNGVLQTHASSLTYYGGGGVNLRIYHRFDLRLIEAGFVRTELPNNGSNQQNTLRVASGVNFHLGR